MKIQDPMNNLNGNSLYSVLLQKSLEHPSNIRSCVVSMDE
jgi:hypothetical protein